MNNFNQKNAKIIYYHFPQEDYWPIPYFSDQMVVIGPYLNIEYSDKTNNINHFIKKKILVKSGAIDLKPILEKVSEIFEPDILICWFDPNGYFLKNINCFKGPKVMLDGDCHHLHRAIEKHVHYSLKEKFDYIICGDRRMVNIFENINSKKNFWLPGFKSQTKLLRPIQNPKNSIAHVGQNSKLHIKRNQYLKILYKTSLPIKQIIVPKKEVFEIYNQNTLSLNISLNGDMNDRWFQVPGAGGVLISNKLTENTGYNRIYSDDEIPTFSSPKEAISIMKKLLTDRELRYKIASKAHYKYINTIRRSRILEEFWKLINLNIIDPLFNPQYFEGSKKIRLIDHNLNWDNLIIYQTILECVRISSNVRVHIVGWKKNSLTYLNDLKDIKVEYANKELVKKIDSKFIDANILVTSNQKFKRINNYDLILKKTKNKDLAIIGYKSIKINKDYNLFLKNVSQFNNQNIKTNILKFPQSLLSSEYQIRFISSQIVRNFKNQDLEVLIIGGSDKTIDWLKFSNNRIDSIKFDNSVNFKLLSEIEKFYDLIIFFDTSDNISELSERLQDIYNLMKLGTKLLFHSGLFILGPYGFTKNFSFLSKKSSLFSNPWSHLEKTYNLFHNREFDLDIFSIELMNLLKKECCEHPRNIDYNAESIEYNFNVKGFHLINKELITSGIKCPFELNFNGYKMDLDSCAISILVEKFNWFEDKLL